MKPHTSFDNIQKVPEVEVDKSAKAEDKVWSNYDELRARQDGEHGVHLENVFFKIACWAIYFFAILLGLSTTIWFLHLILPCSCRWLSPHEVQSLERILFASTLVSVAGKYFSKYKIIKP